MRSSESTSTQRVRKARSSRRLRRIQAVTSRFPLLALHGPQAGTTLPSVYLPPRDIGSTQSRCRLATAALQYAQDPQSRCRSVHSSSVRSLLACATRRARRRWARVRRVMRGATASTVALQVATPVRKSCRPFLRCSPAHLPAPGETVAGVTIHLRNRKFAHKPHNRPLVFGR